jgi:class 3 adenylate cyclase
LYQTVTIAQLSQALPARAGKVDFTPFILYNRTRVLAHPEISSIDDSVDGDDLPLPPLAAFPDPVLRRIWDVPSRPLSMRSQSYGMNGGVHAVDGREIVILHRTLDRYADLPVTLGLYLDLGQDVVSSLWRRLQLTVLLGVGGIIASLAAAILIARAIARPISRLSAAATAVRRDELDTVTPLPPSALRELDVTGRSFNDMVEGLKERRLVRSLLGTYIPNRIASRLIFNKGALAPQLTDATVMFTDIAGFTTLVEGLDPAEIVEILNEYFSVIDGILERHGGVIIQYQGDAVVAVFNIPIPAPRHAREAIEASMEIRGVLVERTFRGHRLPTRIGIASGQVIAGSVGAGGRLSYTVYGDRVNLAARLEALNKQYGTTLLVAEQTRNQVSDASFRFIGEVAIRGKTEPIRIYTIDD